LHREFVASRYVLHKMLWGVLQAQIKGWYPLTWNHIKKSREYG
jgi:hypothetical protein